MGNLKRATDLIVGNGFQGIYVFSCEVPDGYVCILVYFA